MNKSSLLLVSTLCLFAACKGNAYRLNVGPMFAVANGDIALQNAAGTLSLGDNQNDIDSELGTGDTQAAPYARLEASNGKHRFRLHGFGMDANSSGQLLGDFGNIAAGSQVTTSTEFYAISANWGLEVLRGEKYRVAVGAQAGYYSLDVAARSQTSREEGLFGPLTIGANAGIMGADLGDGSGRYWDMEGYLRLQATKNFDLMAGYRYLLLDAYGTATDRDFDADVDVQGVFLTAGIKF
jgi:hypothetical protein